jgi:hypothetical protein
MRTVFVEYQFWDELFSYKDLVFKFLQLTDVLIDCFFSLSIPVIGTMLRKGQLIEKLASGDRYKFLSGEFVALRQ